jgi:hypothetical protein
MNQLSVAASTLFLAFLLNLSFQNCAPVKFSSREVASIEVAEQSISDAAPGSANAGVKSQPESSPSKNCEFDGGTVLHGKPIKAYATSTVPVGSSCSSIDRTCNDGVLDGSASFSYRSCTQETGIPCLAKTLPYANGTCTANLTNASEGQTQKFQCKGRGFADYKKRCDWPTLFVGEQLKQGDVSLTVTCGKSGEWAVTESFIEVNACVETGSLYDCYMWVYQPVEGTVFTDHRDSYQVFSQTLGQPVSYLESNTCCSGKVRIQDCTPISDGNKSCRAFCVN